MTEDETLGIEFGSLLEDLETLDYPLSNEELLDDYGDREISHANGTESLHSMLDPLGQEYQSANEIKQAILNMVSEGAEGRQQYSDRGGTTPNENDKQTL